MNNQYVTRISKARNGCNVLDINPAEVFTRACADDIKSKQLDLLFDKFETYKSSQT